MQNGHNSVPGSVIPYIGPQVWIEYLENIFIAHGWH